MLPNKDTMLNSLMKRKYRLGSHLFQRLLDKNISAYTKSTRYLNNAFDFQAINKSSMNIFTQFLLLSY